MIVWDLGGVVAHFDPAPRLEALAEVTGLPEVRINQAIWGSGLDAAAERGELDEETCWLRTLAALDHRIDRDELRRCWALAFIPDHDVLAVIDRLPGPCAMFTDNGPILEECLHHELGVVSARFQHVLLSWRLQARKAELAAYLSAAGVFGTDQESLTLVDDRTVNVVAARRAGWNALHFTGVPALERQLGRYGND